MANVVQIVITLDNAQANAGLAATTEALNQAGIAGDVSMTKMAVASDAASGKIRLVVAPAAALNAEMRQMGVSSSAAVAGIHQVETATASLERRVISARGEMQQMMLNIQAAQQRDTGALGYRSPVRLGPVTQLGDSFSKIGTAQADMENLGVAFASMPARAQAAEGAIDGVGGAVRRMGGHFNSDLDGVRLMSQEFGFRLPRALESMLARIPAVTTAISSMIGALAGIAIAEVFFEMAKGAYELYEKWFNVTKAVEEYQVKAAEAAQTQLFNTASIETANALLAETSRRVDELTKKRIDSGVDNIPMGGLLQYAASGGDFSPEGAADQKDQVMFSAQDDRDLAATSAQRADAEKRVNALRHEGWVQDAQSQATHDAAVAGSANRASVQQRAAIAAAQNQLSYTRQQEQELETISKLNTKADPKKYPEWKQYHADPAAGIDEYKRAFMKANLEASAANTATSRHERDERITSQNEAINAALEGEAKYRALREQAITAIKNKVSDGDLSARTGATLSANIRLRFDNEQLARTRQLGEEAKRLALEADQAGLEGVPRIAAQLSARLKEVEDARSKATGAGGTLSFQQSSFFDSERDSANRESFAKRRQMDEEFSDYSKSLIASRTEAELSGFQKIDAAAAKEHEDLEKRYSKSYVGPDGLDRGSDENHAARAQASTAIDHASAAEKIKIQQQINDQTLQMDREAAQAERRVHVEGLAGWVQSTRDSLAEIESSRTASRAKITTEQSKSAGGDDSQFERQKVDADRIANAQITQLNQQMRQQVASTLQGAFDDPIHYIQNRMKQMFFQILADWVMQSTAFKSLFSHTMGGLQIGGTAKPSVLSGQVVGSTLQQGGVAAAQMGIGSAGVAAVSNGTISQALVKPGADTTNEGSGITSSGTAEGGGGMVGTSLLSGATGIVGIGLNAARALSGRSSSAAASATSFGNADNGEDGGFAGYMTGDADAGTNGIATSQAQLAGTDDVGSAASRQVQTANQNLAADAQSSGVSQALGVVGAGVGAYTGAQGVVSAFESGHASGILSGAVSGATAGGAIGMLAGPLGGAIGAGIGAAVGATAGLVGWASGEGGRLGAGKYFKDTIRPQMEEEQANYLRGGGGTAVSAISQVNSTAMQGYMYMANKFGADAAMWAKDAYLDKEREKVTDDINRLASAGRDYGARSAVQFHTGGRISGFGDLATSGTEGFIHALMGETVINPVGSSAHGPYLSAVNAGATPADVAAMYLKSSSASSSGSGSSGDTQHHHYNINAIDAKSFRSFLRNGGGMDAIAAESTKRDTRYAGDAA